MDDMLGYEDSGVREVFPQGKIFRISYDSTTNSMKLTCHNRKDLDDVIKAFSDTNPSAFFMSQYGYNVPGTISVISQFGYFASGLLMDVLKYIRTMYGSLSVVEMSENCKKYVQEFITPLKEELKKMGKFDILNISEESGRNEELEAQGKDGYYFREYQDKAIENLIFSGYGRGIFEVGTAGGKSFILANFIYNLQRRINFGFNFLLLVPTKQLVFQMYNDFKDYGMDMTQVTMMTGGLKKDQKYNPKAKIVIGNRQQVFNSYGELPKIDVIMCDEVHTCTAKKTYELIDRLNSRIRIGCTGSIPRKKYDMWQVKGLIGDVMFRKPIGELQREGYVSKMELIRISVTDTNVRNNRNYLFHLNPYRKYCPDENGYSEIPFNAAHDAEHEYYEQYYHDLYKPVMEEISKYDGNTLLLFDKIEFGKRLHEMAGEIFKGRKIHYIDGSVDVRDRLEITRQMEESGDNVLFAENATFSTGVNVKRLTNLVFVSSSKSFPFILQSIGRTLRLHQTKERARIFDISFNFKYSQRHLRERLQIYREVYGKVPDKTVKIEI